MTSASTPSSGGAAANARDVAQAAVQPAFAPEVQLSASQMSTRTLGGPRREASEPAPTAATIAPVSRLDQAAPVNPRSLLAMGMICLAVCVGGWLMFAEPSRRQQAALEQERDKLSADLQHAVEVGDDIKLWTARADTASAELALLASRAGAALTDQTAVDRLSEISRIAGVRLEELRPMDSGTLGAPTTAPAAAVPVGADALAPPAMQDIKRTFRLLITGSFAEFNTFFAQLDGTAQFAAVRSARVVSAGKPGLTTLSAEVIIDMLSPALPKPLAANAAAVSASGTSVSGAQQ